MTFSARDRKRATAVTASMNVETTWRLATRGNTCVVRATGGQVTVPVWVQRDGAWGEQIVERVRKGWRIAAAPALAGVDLGGGGIRIWELKPSKELKRITVAHISPSCVCLSAYPSIPLYFGLSVRAFVNGFRPSYGHRIAECGFILKVTDIRKISLKFENLWKIDKNQKACLYVFCHSYSNYYDSKFCRVSLLERKLMTFKIFYIFLFLYIFLYIYFFYIQ